MRWSSLFLTLFGLCLALASSPAAATPSLSLETQGAVLRNTPPHAVVNIDGLGAEQKLRVILQADGKTVGSYNLGNGSHELVLDEVRLGAGEHQLTARSGSLVAEISVRTRPGWISLLPPLIAIGLALLFKDVLLALFAGVFTGALILADWNPLTAIARSADTYMIGALADADHAKIIVFTLFLGGMVGLISKSGGTLGIVDRLQGYASTTRRGQLATWLLGLAIFFDDYANTLIVGSTMRPITDRLKISREKLAYVVDSTAAPVASLVPISTWIGFELGLIDDAFHQIGSSLEPYQAFLASIPFRFYPIFALVLGFVIAYTGRDFGPMLRAERRARHSGAVSSKNARPLSDYTSAELEPPENKPRRASNAVLPILTVVGVTLIGLYLTGLPLANIVEEDTFSTIVRKIIAESSSYDALIWASFAGMALALLLPLAQKIISITEGMVGLVAGMKGMLLALIVLVLAWAVSAVCGDLHTADFVVELTRGTLSPHLLPVLVFVISAATAFATGSSWGTMGILVPLVIPIAHNLSLASGMTLDESNYMTIMIGTISSVLAGSIWGDHCSPISDTTILSSVASGCDHIDHVRTQLPYALGIGVLGMLIGDIPTAYGVPTWISLILGVVLIVLAVRFFGRRAEDEPNTA